MLAYFRLNDPYRLVGLLVILLLLFLPLFIDDPAMNFVELKSMVLGEKVREGLVPGATLLDPTAPLAAWFFGIVDFLFGRSLLLRHVIAFILILVEAVMIGFIFINRKAFNENTYIPALIFTILFAFSSDTLTLSAELIASFVLILGLTPLFKELEFSNQRDEHIVSLGICMSVASLFVFSYSLFLPGACLILLLFSRRNLRSVLLLFTAFCTPHGLLVSFYFIYGHAGALWEYYYLANIIDGSRTLFSTPSLLFIAALPTAFFVIAFFKLNRGAHLTKYQSQLVSAMFLWVLIGALQLLWANDLRPQSMIVLFPSIAFFITHFFLSFRKRRWAEIVFWIFIGGIVSIAYVSRYHLIENYISYDQLTVPETTLDVKGKKILLLHDDLIYLKDNQQATGFLNWKLSKEIFMHPDYYDNIVLVSNALQRDPPDIIIDPDDLMAGFIARIPELGEKYRRKDGRYELVR